MGIGFGEEIMSGSDVVMCSIRYTGVENDDQFICVDKYASAWQEPPNDSQNDVVTIGTEKLYDTTFKKATLAAVFERPFTTTDTVDDYQFDIPETIDAIWAWGAVTSGSIQGHGSDASKNRNTFQMRLNAPYSAGFWDQFYGLRNLALLMGCALAFQLA